MYIYTHIYTFINIYVYMFVQQGVCIYAILNYYHQK